MNVLDHAIQILSVAMAVLAAAFIVDRFRLPANQRLLHVLAGAAIGAAVLVGALLFVGTMLAVGDLDRLRRFFGSWMNTWPVLTAFTVLGAWALDWQYRRSASFIGGQPKAGTPRGT